MNGPSRPESLSGWRSQLQFANWIIHHQTLGAFGEDTDLVLDFPGIQIRAHRQSAESFDVEFPEQARFRIDFDNRTLGIEAGAGTDPDILEHLVGNQILPRILSHEGVLVLHAASIRVADAALLLVGPSGSGKSTLAASFYADGHHLLGDDAIKIFEQDGTLMAEAVYQSLRLFPDSLAALLPDHQHWAPIAEGSIKRQALALDNQATASEVAVRTILFLDPSPSDEVTFTQLNAAESCFGLIENSFWLDVSDSKRLAHQIEKAGTLATRINAFRLSYPHRYWELETVRSKVIDRIGSPAE